ncbi:uncharacterized protein [Ptychodera flava]|uniref:uncharacterized protein isoform X1 n=1 Tax=Ptychodera flava TaxID=63121 RepID=UPI003969EEEB
MATAEILVDETTNTQRRVETQHLDVDIGMADGDVMTDYPRQAMRFSNSGDSYNDSRFSSKSISQAGTSGTQTVGQVTDKGVADTDVTSAECDVFFSYSSKDKDWVIQTAERLEKEYDIECSYDSKDFIGGKAITTNIMNCIKMSRKTVLVLSPDFLRSPWCGYEMQIVLREHLFREQKVVIPVLLHDCIIPDFISHLTYLEVQDPQFWEKFLEILKTDNTENETLSELFSFGHEADKFNGKTIATFSSNLDTSDVYNTMSSRGIRVTKEDIEGAFGTLLKTTPSRCYYRCLRSLTLLILHVIAIVMIMLFILILTVLYFGFLSEGIPPWTTGSENDPPSFVLYCLLIVTLIALIATFFMVRRILHKAERAVNYDLLRYDIIVGYVRTSCCSEKGLHVVYFKSSKCLDTLERYLKAKQTKGKILESSGTSIEDSAANEYDTNDSEITPLLDTTDLESGTKEKARKTIAEICGDYVRKVNKQKLRNPVRGQRHTRQGLCLCQYVESEKFKEVV